MERDSMLSHGSAFLLQEPNQSINQIFTYFLKLALSAGGWILLKDF